MKREGEGREKRGWGLEGENKGQGREDRKSPFTSTACTRPLQHTLSVIIDGLSFTCHSHC